MILVAIGKMAIYNDIYKTIKERGSQEGPSLGPSLPWGLGRLCTNTRLHPLKSPKQIHINIVGLSLTQDQRQYCGEKIVFTIDDIGTTRHPHGKKKSRHRPYTLYNN